jgi:hypothetical protein
VNSPVNTQNRTLSTAMVMNPAAIRAIMPPLPNALKIGIKTIGTENRKPKVIRFVFAEGLYLAVICYEVKGIGSKGIE